MSRWDKYINLPYREFGRDFDGVDCYGLITLIYNNELGIIIPDYTDLLCSKTRHNLKEKQDHILNSIGIKWVPLKNDKFKVYDALVFNKRSNSAIAEHIGMYIGGGKFIHALEDHTSMINRLDSPFWKSTLYGAMRFHGNSNLSKSS